MARCRELSAEEAELLEPHSAPPTTRWLQPIGWFLRSKLNYRGERVAVDGDEEERAPPRRNGARPGEIYLKAKQAD
jgi:hypothetical protein